MELLGTADTARRLGCSPERVRQLEAEGKLNSVRTVTGYRIFRADEVERLAEERAKVAEEKQQRKMAA